MTSQPPPGVIYEVECRVQHGRAAEFDAWLPGHVRDVLSCEGFSGADILRVEDEPDGAAVRRVQYRLDDTQALQRYLERDAARLRADGAARFGDALHCSRRVLTRVPMAPAAAAPVPCQNCEAPVAGPYCTQCGQAAGTHVLSVAAVARDIVHSGLHLDSRAWRTLRSLLLRPGELTREFIAGRRQRYLPPFRLYLVISIGFFALSALLPDIRVVRLEDTDSRTIAPVTVRTPVSPQGAPDGPAPAAAPATAATDLDVALRWPWLDQLLERASERLRDTDGRRLDEVFLRNAPKLMFLFLPLVAAVAMPFYRRPRRYYVEHLVLFLHVHAFLFLWLAALILLGQATAAGPPLAGPLGLVNVLLLACAPWYVFRAMRVVYGDSRTLTAAKLAAIAAIYLTLLMVTMVAGVVYSILSL